MRLDNGVEIETRFHTSVIPNRFLFLWTGRGFPYYARLAIESALLAEPDTAAEIWLFGPANPNALHLRALSQYERVTVHTVEIATAFDGLAHAPAVYRELYERIPQTAYSAQSNLLRYALLNQRGGIYLDLDIIMLAGFNGLRHNRAFVGEEVVWKSDEARVANGFSLTMLPSTVGYAAAYGLRRIDSKLFGNNSAALHNAARLLDPIWSTRAYNNAVIGAVPGSRFIRRVMAMSLDADPNVRYALGPSLVTRAVRASDVDVTRVGPEVFYCQPPSYSFRFFESRHLTLPRSARLIHYVASNHKKRLARLSSATINRPPSPGVFYRLASQVAAKAINLPLKDDACRNTPTPRSSAA